MGMLKKKNPLQFGSTEGEKTLVNEAKDYHWGVC